MELPASITLEKLIAWVKDTSFTMSIDSYRFGSPVNVIQNVYLSKDFNSKKVYMITQELNPYSEPAFKESIAAVVEVTDAELLALYQTFENLENQKCELKTAAQERAMELKLI